MKYITKLTAVDCSDGLIKTWVGQTIEAPNYQLAEEYLMNNGLGYLEIIGELISTTNQESGNTINFENLN